jgi:hypothetical protein
MECNPLVPFGVSEEHCTYWEWQLQSDSFPILRCYLYSTPSALEPDRQQPPRQTPSYSGRIFYDPRWRAQVNSTQPELSPLPNELHCQLVKVLAFILGSCYAFDFRAFDLLRRTSSHLAVGKRGDKTSATALFRKAMPIRRSPVFK